MKNYSFFYALVLSTKYFNNIQDLYKSKLVIEKLDNMINENIIKNKEIILKKEYKELKLTGKFKTLLPNEQIYRNFYNTRIRFIKEIKVDSYFNNTPNNIICCKNGDVHDFDKSLICLKCNINYLKLDSYTIDRDRILVYALALTYRHFVDRIRLFVYLFLYVFNGSVMYFDNNLINNYWR